MDLFGNEYLLLDSFLSMNDDVFFFCLLLICYFNVKRLLLFKIIPANKSRICQDRKTRLILVSVINLLHLFFYCLSLENIIKIDLCGFTRMVFLLVEV